MSKLPRADGFSLLEIIVVVGLVGLLSVIAVPMFGNALGSFRLSGDARSISNATAVAKMRAAATFTNVRLYVNLDGEAFHIEAKDKTSDLCCWAAEGGVTYLSPGVDFGFGVVGAPPPSTQAAIAQAAACKDDMGDDIANTACVVFNSRGVPVPTTADGAVYVTDGTAVYGVTVAATGMIRLWRTLPTVTPSWQLN